MPSQERAPELSSPWCFTSVFSHMYRYNATSTYLYHTHANSAIPLSRKDRRQPGTQTCQFLDATLDAILKSGLGTSGGAYVQSRMEKPPQRPLRRACIQLIPTCLGRNWLRCAPG